MIRIQVKGLDSAIKLLGNFKRRRRNRLIHTGLKKLGDVLVKAVKKRVPKRSGTMRRSIQRKVKQSGTNTDRFFLIVGVRSKFTGEFDGKPVIPHKTGHLVIARRKQFTQRIIMTPGKKLVINRKVIEGKQYGLKIETNRGNLAYVKTRIVRRNVPKDIFYDAKRIANRALIPAIWKVLKALLR